MVRCKCGRDAIIYVAYAAQSLCRRHFLDYFERRVKRTIREFNLLQNTKHIGVAISGGKDSLTTLYLLWSILRKTKVQLTAIFVNEGIKGYRDRLIKDAQKLCKRLNVPLRIYSFEKEVGTTMDSIIKRKEREISCTYCGVFRRWILNKAARELGMDRLAVGHNLDDVCQSFLMNVFRNEPFRLARFGPRSGIVEDDGFVPRIRPLFRTPEKEVAVYAMLKGFKREFFGCPYVEEAFRPIVRNFLNNLESRYPGTKFKIFNFYMAAKAVLEEKYKKEVITSIARCELCGEPTSAALCKRCELLRGLALPT